LIKRGHKFDDLCRVYTMEQVWYFYEAGQENVKHETLDMAIAMRMAFGSDKKDWAKYIQVLSPKRPASIKIMSKEKYRMVRSLLSGK
jgi:hypothetical protein